MQLTRSLHIKIVTDLSTEEFLNALGRLVSKRDLPALIYGDNAINFIGSRVLNQNVVGKYLSENRIDQKTIAPQSPHQGEIWEAAIKFGKGYLAKAIGGQMLNLVELHTIATKVEAILNQRPIQVTVM